MYFYLLNFRWQFTWLNFGTQWPTFWWSQQQSGACGKFSKKDLRRGKLEPLISIIADAVSTSIDICGQNLLLKSKSWIVRPTKSVSMQLTSEYWTPKFRYSNGQTNHEHFVKFWKFSVPGLNTDMYKSTRQNWFPKVNKTELQPVSRTSQKLLKKCGLFSTVQN